MKHLTKRIIALLCVLSLLPWTYLPATAITTVTDPTTLEQWDVDTVRLPMKTIDCFAGNNGKGTATGKSQDGTSFNAKITFPGNMTNAAHYVNFWIGEEWSGYVIQATANKKTLSLLHFSSHGTPNISVELQPSDFGLETLVGIELTVNLTTEFINTNGSTTDVHTGLYINGKLFKDSYITIENVSTNAFPQNVYILNNAAPGVTVVDVVTEDTPDTPTEPDVVTPPDQLEGWDIKTVQLPMNSIDCFAGANGYGIGTGKSQNGTSFNAKITFPGNITAANHYVNFWIGEEGNGYVIQAGPNKKSLTFMHFPSNMSVELYPSDFGMDTLVGTELVLNLTTEFFNTNGNTTDVHTGLYINGKLYNDDYITIQGTSTTAFPQDLHIVNNTAPGVTLVDVIYEEIVITPPEQLEQWSTETVGLADGAYPGYHPGTATGNSQDGKAFSVNILFPDALTGAEYANVWIGNEGTGYVIQAHANNPENLVFMHFPSNLNVNLTPADFGLTTLLGQKLKLIVTTVFVNTKGSKTDVNVGLYINGILYKDSYISIKDVDVSAFPQNMLIRSDAGGKAVVLEDTSPVELVTPLESFEKWTISDVGLEGGEYYSYHPGTAIEKSQDGTAFYGCVQYPAGMESGQAVNLWIGEELNGYILQGSMENHLYFAHFSNSVADFGVNISPEKVGMESFAGEKLDVTVTTEFVNNDGQFTDVNVGLYINGILYNGKYLKLKHIPVDKFKQQVVLDTRSTGGKPTGLWEDSQCELEELTIADFGMESNAKIDKTSFYGNEQLSLSATAVNMLLKFPNEQGAKMVIGGENQGVCLAPDQKGNLILSYVDDRQETQIAILIAKTAGVRSLTDRWLDVRLEFKIYKTGEDTGKLLLAIYLDDQLYNNEMFEVKDVALSSLMRIIHFEVSGKAFYVEVPGYEELTFNDFSVIDTTINAVKPNEPVMISNYRDYRSLNETAVSVRVKFGDKEGDRFSLGGDTWQGISVIGLADGRIQVVYVGTDETLKNITYLIPEKAGVTALTGETIEMRMTFDLYKTADGKADLRLGIFINGKLYDNRYLMVKDVDTKQMTRTCMIYVTAGPFEVKSTYKKPDLSIYGF